MLKIKKLEETKPKTQELTFKSSYKKIDKILHEENVLFITKAI